MSVDFNALLLKPLYAVGALGSPATLALHDGSSAVTFNVTVIDKTDGLNVGNNVDVPTIVPVACIRKTEVVGLGLSNDDLIDALITFNGFTWKISNVKPKANPSGELNGELYLSLTSQTTEEASSG